MKVMCVGVKDAKNFQVDANLTVPMIDKNGYFDTDKDTLKRLQEAQPGIFIGEGEDGYVEPIVEMSVDEQAAYYKNKYEEAKLQINTLTQKNSDLTKANEDLQTKLDASSKVNGKNKTKDGEGNEPGGSQTTANKSGENKEGKEQQQK